MRAAVLFSLCSWRHTRTPRRSSRPAKALRSKRSRTSPARASLPHCQTATLSSGRRDETFTSYQTPTESPAHRRLCNLDDERAAGVAFAAARQAIYVATMHHVWEIPYGGGRSATQPQRIADVRTGPVAPGTDGDVHTTTSVAFSGGLLRCGRILVQRNDEGRERALRGARPFARRRLGDEA